jgi:hypothetical protein
MRLSGMDSGALNRRRHRSQRLCIKLSAAVFTLQLIKVSVPYVGLRQESTQGVRYQLLIPGQLAAVRLDEVSGS